MGQHRRTLSAASVATDASDALSWHDAQETLEQDLDSAHEEGDAYAARCDGGGTEVPPEATASVDWTDEAQMLPANNNLSLEERMTAIHSMRKIVLAEPDAGAGSAPHGASFCGLRLAHALTRPGRDATAPRAQTRALGLRTGVTPLWSAS